MRPANAGACNAYGRKFCCFGKAAPSAPVNRTLCTLHQTQRHDGGIDLRGQSHQHGVCGEQALRRLRTLRRDRRGERPCVSHPGEIGFHDEPVGIQRYRGSARYHGPMVQYSADEIDFIAAYVVAHDAWYIIPISELGNTKQLHLYPAGTKRTDAGRFEKYREAWDLLRRGAVRPAEV
jgi:hypothetical protein